MKTFACSLMLFLGLTAAGQIVADDPPVKKPEPGKKEAAKDDDRFELVIPGQILNEDPRDKIRNVPCKIHAVKLMKGKGYQIDMVSTEIDSYLRLEDSVGTTLGQDDDGGGNLNSRIRFTAPKDDIYLIYASPLGGGEGSYTLSVRSYVAQPVKLIPLPAPTAKAPTEIQAQLNANDAVEPTRNRPGQIYTVELKAGKNYDIDMISNQFDCYLFLQDGNAAPIAQDDDSGGNLNSRIQFRCAADGRYRIIATTFNGAVGRYTLRVTDR